MNYNPDSKIFENMNDLQAKGLETLCNSIMHYGGPVNINNSYIQMWHKYNHTSDSYWLINIAAVFIPCALLSLVEFYKRELKGADSFAQYMVDKLDNIK